MKFARGQRVAVTIGWNTGARGTVIDAGMDNELTYCRYRIRFDQPIRPPEREDEPHVALFDEHELRAVDLVEQIGELSDSSQ